MLAVPSTPAEQGPMQHAGNAAACAKQAQLPREGTLTMGIEFSSCSEGDSGVLAIMRCLSSRVMPCGRLPITAGAMKLLCRLADPRDFHRAWSSCRQVGPGAEDSAQVGLCQPQPVLPCRPGVKQRCSAAGGPDPGQEAT